MSERRKFDVITNPGNFEGVLGDIKLSTATLERVFSKIISEILKDSNAREKIEVVLESNGHEFEFFIRKLMERHSLVGNIIDLLPKIQECLKKEVEWIENSSLAPYAPIGGNASSYLSLLKRFVEHLSQIHDRLVGGTK